MGLVVVVVMVVEVGFHVARLIELGLKERNGRQLVGTWVGEQAVP